MTPDGGSWTDWLWPALGLMLVLEGLMPLLHPQGWREVFRRVLAMQDGQIRFIGLASIAIGALVLWLSS
ncbi:DUF2065 domain-containing protein [Ideonella sp. 4Y16]|uniref:DUF2065 domain-containing protein n=1 Tax=Ideonella alba TaxID=2824118 RepID=UPI001B3656DD|nr:DUF2065 domain-containing protein [Ideonella alba]MBQ0942464.1 DUF2065 domain-containing protein [Ideonella alba]